MRQSNLELYRIICMLTIVAHHYMLSIWGVMYDDIFNRDILNIKIAYYHVFGAWAKAAINGFVLITGYFMGKSHTTLKKFLKLLFEVLFYNVVIFSIFLFFGREQLSIERLLEVFIPFRILERNFVGCFLVFYLLIPFINILLSNISHKQHLILVCLLLCIFTVFGTLEPIFEVTFSYVSWFIVLYLIAAYFRRIEDGDYEVDKRVVSLFKCGKFWRRITLALIIVSIISIVALLFIRKNLGWHYYIAYWLLNDSNRILAVLLAISSFMWFKGLPIKSNFINGVATSTFGVLLIHDNCRCMRDWLWTEVIGCQIYYNSSLISIILHSTLSVIVLFIACICIDRIRIHIFEKPIMKLL